MKNNDDLSNLTNLSIISETYNSVYSNLDPEARVNASAVRRRSSIFPAFLRQKSADLNRKDSIFASESTLHLLPYDIQDVIPNINYYKNLTSDQGIKRPSLDQLHQENFKVIN